MSYVKSIFCAVVLFGTLAQARDVNPNEKLGKLQVTSVDIKNLGSKLDPRYLNATFTIDGHEAKIQIGGTTDVAAGVGCLEIQYTGSSNFNYKASQCGIKIEEKQTTVIPLGAVKFAWDISSYVADFGPQPLFTFNTKDADRTFSASLNPADPEALKDNVFLSPAMTLNRYLVHDQTGLLSQDTTAVAGGAANLVNIPSQEFRGQILLDFIDGKPILDVQKTQNNIAAVYAPNYGEANVNRAIAPSNIESASDGFQRLYNDYNYFKFAVNGVSKSIRAYPLVPSADGPVYYVSINEHMIKTTLETGKVFRIPVATLNVHNYKTTIAGSYRVFSDRNTPGKLVEYRPKVRNQSYVQSTLFPTETSLFFPIGHTYRLDFYAVDAAGRTTLQDQVVVDLTHE